VILEPLAKQPADRFPSIAAFAQAFQAAVQGTDARSGTIAPNASGNTIARNPGSSADIRATLAISRQEALTGTSRTLTLPGGRQVTIAVPAGTQNGQVIYLGGQGEPSGCGGPTGSLVLTIAIQQAERASPTSNVGSAEPTVHASKTNLPRSMTYPAITDLTGQSIPAGKTGGGKDAALSFLRSRKGLLIGLMLLIVVGSLGFFYFSYFNYVQRIFLLNTAPQNPYAANGTIALNDPLRDNSNGYSWAEGSNSYGTCQFTRGAYQVSISQGKYEYCNASTDFSNFACESAEDR
jgi:hypothetical protein